MSIRYIWLPRNHPQQVRNYTHSMTIVSQQSVQQLPFFHDIVVRPDLRAEPALYDGKYGLALVPLMVQCVVKGHSHTSPVPTTCAAGRPGLGKSLISCPLAWFRITTAMTSCVTMSDAVTILVNERLSETRHV